MSILRMERSDMVKEALADQWEKNYVRNKDAIVKHSSDPVKYGNMKTFDRCLVVGAGPSLGRNMGDVDRKLYEVAACDKTCPRLVEHGIRPDLVFALNAEETDVQEWIAPADDGDAMLVMPCGVHPDTYADWSGPMAFINAMTPTGLSIRIEHELKMRQFSIGSNAGTFAYSMCAMWCGAKIIGCIGLDFSFLNRSTVMARYDAEEYDPKKYNVLEMTDINGNVRFLDLGWFDMAMAFQERARNFKDWFGTRTINCTEGGINYSEFVEAMTLNEFNRMLREAI